MTPTDMNTILLTIGTLISTATPIILAIIAMTQQKQNKVVTSQNEVRNQHLATLVRLAPIKSAL